MKAVEKDNSLHQASDDEKQVTTDHSESTTFGVQLPIDPDAHLSAEERAKIVIPSLP